MNWFKKAQQNIIISEPIAHGTTSLSIRNSFLKHPQNLPLFFSVVGDPDVETWAFEIAGEYGGLPIIAILSPQNASHYKFEIGKGKIESHYYFTRDSINIKDLQIQKLAV